MANKFNEDVNEAVNEDEVREFQALQQQLQMLVYQKQQAIAQLSELDKSVAEVTKSDGSCYRYVGTVIVPKNKDVLLKDLSEEKETLEMRKSLFQKQEDKLKEKFDALRKKLEAQLAARGEGTVLSG